MNQWPHQSEVDHYYGNPRGPDGEVSPSWERNNIVRMPVPWGLVTAWDFQPVSAIRVHMKCTESLSRVLNEIWLRADRSDAKIKEWGMHLYGGGFNFRPMRGRTTLSMHSWGCAVDFDPSRNSFGDSDPHFAHLPVILDAFAAEGWVWGGRWSKPDGMHFQGARL